MTTRSLAAVFLIGSFTGVIFAFLAGAIYGWCFGREVGDSQNVWFEPGAGTAFFFAACFPLLFLGIPLAFGCAGGLAVGSLRGASGIQSGVLELGLLLALTVAAFQLHHFRHLLERPFHEHSRR